MPKPKLYTLVKTSDKESQKNKEKYYNTISKKEILKLLRIKK